MAPFDHPRHLKSRVPPPGFKTRLNKSDRKEIIRSVCRLNRAIYYVSKMVSDDTNLLLRPCIDTGEEKIDPLRDVRVVGVLRDADVEEFCITGVGTW